MLKRSPPCSSPCAHLAVAGPSRLGRPSRRPDIVGGAGDLTIGAVAERSSGVADARDALVATGVVASGTAQIARALVREMRAFPTLEVLRRDDDPIRTVVVERGRSIESGTEHRRELTAAARQPGGGRSG